MVHSQLKILPEAIRLFAGIAMLTQKGLLILNNSVRPDGQIICSIFGPDITMKIWLTTQKFAIEGLKFCQILKRPSKNGQRLKIFAKVAKMRQIWSPYYLFILWRWGPGLNFYQ